MRTLIALLVGLVLVGPGPALAHPPVAGPVSVFANQVPGPEGLAFARDRTLVVGTATGEVRRYLRDGSFTTLATLGEPLAGITVLHDGRILAASFGPGRVWEVPAAGGPGAVFASGIAGPNFIVETRARRILVSASTSGTIEEITTGVPVTRGTGLNYANGLAIRDGFLYVAETLTGRISRLAMAKDGSLGAPEVYATGALGADGIAFDRHGNLLIAGFDMLSVVARGANTATTLSSDPLLNWPSNLAFGRGRGFARKDVFLANFGAPLGSGMEIVRVGYNHSGARLAR